MIHPQTLSTKWPQRPLGEVVEFLDHIRKPVKESERVEGPYPYYGANGQVGTINDYLFDEPLVLLAEDGGFFGMEGRKIAYKVNGKYWVNNHAHVLRPGPEIDLDFLCRHLEEYNVLPFISGTTRAKLTKGQATNIPLVLPPLEEQKRIAAILDKADGIRRKRREAIKLADQFLRSVFLDMFGDPVTNPKGWDEDNLGEHLEFLTSGSRGWAKYYSKKGDKFIRIQNVGKNELILDDMAYVDPPSGAEANRTRVQAGDVLLSITADLGRTAVIPDDLGAAYINQHLAILRLKDLESIYFSAYLASNGGQIQFKKLNKEGVKAGLNFDDIRSLKVVLPPKNLRNRYIDIWKKHYENLVKDNEALCVSNTLFNSLTQRAFRGEL